VPTACNRSTADFLIDSPHFGIRYNKILKDYSQYINRNID
jgi:methylglyoxal synthase